VNMPTSGSASCATRCATSMTYGPKARSFSPKLRRL
jgi:hypothetical protein